MNFGLWLHILCNAGTLQEGAGLDPASPLDPPCGQPPEGQHGRLSPRGPAALLLPSAATVEWYVS